MKLGYRNWVAGLYGSLPGAVVGLATLALPQRVNASGAYPTDTFDIPKGHLYCRPHSGKSGALADTGSGAGIGSVNREGGVVMDFRKDLTRNSLQSFTPASRLPPIWQTGFSAGQNPSVEIADR
jgi:hypothetical protein